MKHFKLNFSRFENEIEVANLVTRVTVDDSGVSSSAKRVSSSMNLMSSSIEGVVDANLKLAKTSSDKRIGTLRLAQAGIGRFNEAKNLVSKMSNNPHVSSKTRASLSTLLATTKSRGLDNLKEEYPQSLDRNSVGGMMSLGDRLSKAGIKAVAEEQKYYNDAAKEGLNILEQNAKQAIKNKQAMEKQAEAMQKASEKTKKADENTNKFTETMKKLAGAAVRWRILYGAFSRIWNVLSDTVDKAAAYEEAINLYTVALGDYAEKASEWRDRISEALYLDPKYVMQYTGALYNLVQGLGVSADAAYKMSTNLTQLAYDMSSYLNIDVESAYAKIQSAMTGQSRAVASAGIAMQQASLQELAYSMGIEKLVTDMTQAEKTYLRYIQIMRSTTKMQGDLGRTIITPENALRVIRQQFEMLGRAIGQVFIPIIMKAIPYVMALTQILTELAKKLSQSLGFEIAKIDYSGLTTADTAVEDAFTNMSTSADKGSKKVKDSINRTLAAFDELNVVESESAGAGGGAGGGGSPAATIGALEPYITGYDMLKDLTTDWDDKVEIAKKNLLNFWEVIKKIGTALLFIKGIKLLSNFANFVDKIKESAIAGKGLPGIFNKIGQGLKSVLGYGKLFGTTFVSNLKSGNGVVKGLGAAFNTTRTAIKNTVPVWGQVAGSVATAAASFKLCSDATTDFNNGQIGTAEAIGKTTTSILGLSAAGFMVGGPIGAAAAAISGLAGVVITSWKQINAECDAIEERAQRMRDEENLAKFFADSGFSAQLLIDDIKDLTDETSKYAGEVKTAKDKLDETSGILKSAGDNFSYVHDKVLESEQDGTLIDEIKESVKRYKAAIDDNKQAQIDYHTLVLNNLRDEKYITEKDYKEMTDIIIGEINKQTLAQAGYIDELEGLEEQYNNGEISLSEYNAEVERLHKEYIGLIPSTDALAKSAVGMNSAMNTKIDFSDYNEVIKTWDNLKKGYEEGRKQIEETKKKNDEFFRNQLNNNQALIDDIERLPKEERKQYEGRLEELKTAREEIEKEQRTAALQYQDDLVTLSSTFKNYSGLLLAQMAQNNVAFTDELKGTTKDIEKTLSDLGDVDISKSVKPRLQEYLASIKKEGGNVSVQTLALVNTWVNKIDNTTWDVLSGGLLNGMKIYGSKFRTIYENTLNDSVVPVAEKSANTITLTMFDGLLDGREKIEDAGKKSALSFDDGLIGSFGDIHKTGIKTADEYLSGIQEEAGLPTKLGGSTPTNKGVGKIGAQMGKTMTNSFIAELPNSRKTIGNEVGDLVSDIQSSLNKKPFELKFNNTQSSFNSILKTLQAFSSKWGIGITDLLNNTKLSFGGLTFKDGKLSFNPFKMINIKMFAEGGYPTSGDLFFANENGRAEYITSLGNKTAVANQDQMVSALTNAIVQGMSNIETNRQPGVTQVYIGNDKVYEGQGQYQNRQAERYGTAVIKI